MDEVEEAPGTDEYGRVWRLAPSGVEHMLRDEAHMPSDPIRAMVLMGRLGNGQVLSWCGRDIGSLPPSGTHGAARPCARCLAGEFAAE